MQENIVEAVRDLQREIGFGNAEKGFHEEGIETIGTYVAVRQEQKEVFPNPTLNERAKRAARDYRRYAAQRIMLVVTELSEAFEEVRDGRSMTETYYPTRIVDDGQPMAAGEQAHIDSIPHKPEGVPSELADVLIRVLDIGDEFGIDLAAMVQEKLAYNASRPKMHGRKF